MIGNAKRKEGGEEKRREREREREKIRDADITRVYTAYVLTL